MANPTSLRRPPTGHRYDPTAIDATGATLGHVLTAVDDGSGGQRVGFAAQTGGGGGGGGSGSGGDLLGEYTASAGSSIDMYTRNATGQSGALFQSDYDHYRVETSHITVGTNGAHVVLRAGYGATPTIDTGTNYEWSRAGADTAGGAATDTGSASASPRLFASLTNTAGYGFGVASFTVSNPLTTGQRRYAMGNVGMANTTPRQVFTVWGWTWTDTTNPMTALQILPSTGTITGTVRVYGVPKTGSAGGGGGSSGALVLVGSYSASASSSVDMVSRNATGMSGAIFQSDYDVYVFDVVNLVVATDGTALNLRFSTDGGSSYATTSYSTVRLFNDDTATGAGGNDSGAASVIELCAACGNTTNFSVNGSYKIFNPLGSIYKSLIGQVSHRVSAGDARRGHSTAAGIFESTTAVNAMRILAGSGNITSGTIYVYGVAKVGGGGGGSALYPFLDPFAPDDTATASYEFDDNDLSAFTTVYTGDAGVTYDAATTLPKGLFIESPDSQYKIRSFLLALPGDTNWTIHAAVEHAFYRPNDTLIGHAGIILADGTTAGAGSQKMCTLSTHAGTSWSELNWQKFGLDGTGASVNSRASYDRIGFLRFRKQSGTYYMGWSSDGRVWLESTVTLGFTPTHFGVMSQNYTGAVGQALFHYLRYYNIGTQYRTGATRTISG